MTNTFAPTPAELALVSQIFAHADPQKLGVLTGDVAVRVFGGANLPPTVLGEIWNIADEENKGWLPKKGVSIAVRLIGWAQKGEKITQALVNKPGPLAVIEGITVVSQQTTGMSLPKSPPPTFPPLTPQDRAKFQNMFLKYGPSNGLLSGEKARDIFVKSKLSNEQLLKIWNLADTQDRGSLDATDFTIGMYFIQGVMTGKISFIPTSLPPGLYQQAGGLANTSSVQSHVTGTSGSFSPIGSAFPSHPTGQSQMLQPDYTGSFKSSSFSPLSSAPIHGNGHAQDWDITPAEKASSDTLFQSLDKQKKGYIEGDVAVPFMLKSQLPGEDLAQVWDLADFNNDGRLTSDGFAIAMHLIQKKLAGKDIPATLPPSLIPPSARSSAIGASPFASTPLQAVQQPEPVVDLFSFDDPPPVSSTVTQPTNTSVKSQSTPGTFPPATSKPSAEADPFNTFIHRDLLSDDDIHTASSPPLQDQSAEIGNLKNQLQSTNRSLSGVKEEREALEQTLANQASLLSTIQTQLSSAKAAYETETNLLAALKERRSNQITDIQKAREELIRAESDLSAVRVEKAEIEGAFLRDKEEARDLHKRMVEAGKQADALKADVEKLKKEAKQQKGLLAIARKQLSTKEGEKAKVEKEHEEAVAELTSITQEKEAVEAEVAKLESESVLVLPKSPSDSLAFAAAQPLPVTPEIPSPSPAKRNNPFERLAMSSGNSTPRSQSPFLALSGNIVASPSAMESAISQPATLPTDNAEEAVEPAEPDLFNVSNEFSSNHVVSPATANETEYFMTPPTSAVNEPDQAASLKERFPSLDDLPPPASLSSSTAPPAANPSSEHAGTDLNAQLKEMDVEESDSDEDSDFHELKVTEPSAANGKPLAEPSASHIIESSEQTTTSNISFDDVFGSDDAKESKPNDPAPAPVSFTAVSTNGADRSPPPEPAPPVVAGVNEFDETLGKVPPSAAATPAAFSFDTAFDDNFDFASASKAAEFTQPQPEKQAEVQGNNDFEKIFGTVNSSLPGPSVQAMPPASQPTTVVPPSNAPQFDNSFEEVFTGFDSVNAPKFDDKLFTATAAPSMPVTSLPGSFPSSPTPAQVSAPTSPKNVTPAPRAVEVRTTSPLPRERSPPPRMASPKPRLSSSSSKEANEKLKEPPARHSKLSIRLPFGKKKKHQESMPLPSSHLTPPIEHPQRIATPASDDDVEPVKQLTAMGFSRSQAVDALEKYGYDVQKALNSLLGQ